MISREQRSALKLKLTQQDKELNMHSQGAAAVLVNTATRAGIGVSGLPEECISPLNLLSFSVRVYIFFSTDFVCLHFCFFFGLTLSFLFKTCIR